MDQCSCEVTDEILAHYSKIRIKPKRTNYNRELFKDYADDSVEEYGVVVAEGSELYNVVSFVEPNDAQIEALYSLKRMRENGADKSLVVVATGVGKTYLAAFDTIPFKRVLFIAHREEILRQAYSSFSTIRGSSNLIYYNGSNIKDGNVVFASVQTLSKQDHLDKFESDYFDYIVIKSHDSKRISKKLLSSLPLWYNQSSFLC